MLFGRAASSIEQQWSDHTVQVIDLHKPELLVSVIPDFPPAIYAAIKTVTTVKKSVFSQVSHAALFWLWWNLRGGTRRGSIIRSHTHNQQQTVEDKGPT